MRDLFVTLVVFGSLPVILRWPHVGVLMWTWLAFMNPHRLTWGFAYDMQFAFIVGITTLVSLVLSREPKKVPWTRESILLLIFVGWMFITTLFAAFSELAWPQMDKVAKIMLMVFVTMMLMQSKLRLNLLVWVMTLSLAFYGTKGGIFTITTAGAHHVRGPDRSFIGGDNEIGLALIMTIPLLRYLQLSLPTRWAWAHPAMTAGMVLTAIAAVGSQSRGALVGLVAMGVFLWLKTRNKIFTGLMGTAAAVIIGSIMPQQWFDRMESMQNYETDHSAQGRMNAWSMAINLAKDRPLGGGFEAFHPLMFAQYAPHPGYFADAHSIYFEVLGEHGFVGLALFLLLGLMTWRTCSWIMRQARGAPQNRWAADLASMVQVSLVGYASAGAFLGLAYFDFYYTLVAVVVLCKTVLVAQAAAAKPQTTLRPSEAMHPALAVRPRE